jgi:pimeloyl-ACP methyl ester carboxylesterase
VKVIAGRHTDPVPDPHVFIPGLVTCRVAARDGTPLSVQVIDDHGGGKPTLLLVNGIGGTVVTYAHLIRRCRAFFRVVCFDTRGLHGSGRPVGGPTSLEVPFHAEDVIAVADGVGADRFHALGWSMGVQVLIEAVRRLSLSGAQDRVLSLTLHNGTAGRAFAEVFGQRALAPVVDPVLAGLARIDGLVERAVAALVMSPMLRPTLVSAGLLHEAADRDMFAAAARGFGELDAATFLHILRGLGRHDAWDAVPSIMVPAIVVAGRRDLLTPLSTMTRLAAALPSGRLTVIDAGTHYAAIELPDEFQRAVIGFWRDVGVDGIDDIG